MSFDREQMFEAVRELSVLIPFVQGSVFRQRRYQERQPDGEVLIPFVQGSVFRRVCICVGCARAVLIPFVQGSVFRPHHSQPISPISIVLIPFVQGSVFRRNENRLKVSTECLNPFRTGQCLSTKQYIESLTNKTS